MTKMSQTINKTPQFEVLSEDEIERIYFAALDVLETVGARFYHEEAVQLFQDSAAHVTDGNLVRVPASLVERAIKSHPRKIGLTGRNGKRSVMLQKDEVAFGTGSDLPFTYDRETGKRRRTCYQDVTNAGKIVDYLPNFDFFMSHGIVQDVPNHLTYDRHQLMAMLESNTKPYILTSVNGDGLRDLWRMCCLFRGGEKEYRLNPMFVTYIEPISPLMNDKTAVEKLLFSAEKGIPCMYTPCPSAGGTAPATLAGMIVQSLSETLLASTLSYLKNPGMPLVMGGVTTVLDMLTTTFSYGAPELSLASAANTQVSKWLGILMFSTGGCTDSKIVDQQAAIESMTSNFYAMLSGANFVHDVGYIDSGTNASLESLVMNDEIIGMIRQFAKGINTSEEHLALQLIDEVGPGGEYVTRDHTFEHWREWFFPKLQDRTTYESWEQQGKKTMDERVYEETERILQEYEPEPIDDKIYAELKAIVADAEERHKEDSSI